jgi:N-acetylneuraminic acid mutarotase
MKNLLNKARKVLFLLTLIIVITPQGFAQTEAWIQKTDFTGAARRSPASFAIGNNGYVVAGLKDFNTAVKDAFEYGQTSDSWTQISDFPGTTRYSTGHFTIGTRAWVGIGIEGSTAYDDVWTLDGADNSWSGSAAFTSAFPRVAPASFVVGGTGYWCGGKNGTYSSECWAYDTTSNTWTQMANFGGVARKGAFAFVLNGLAYVGAGYNGAYLADIWAYDPMVNSWTQVADFGGGSRTGHVSFVLNGEAYVGAGIGAGSTYFKDMWKYTPATDEWIQVMDFGGSARQGAAAFVINGKAYVGLGNDGVNDLTDLWEYTSGSAVSVSEPPTKAKELLYITDILGRSTYPVPNRVLFYIYDDGSVEKKIRLEW